MAEQYPPTARQGLHMAPEARGGLTIRARAVGRITERAVLAVPGVLQHSTRRAAITTRELPRAVVDMSSDHPNVSVSIAVVWPSPVTALCRQVRERVVADVSRLTGRVPSRIDVTVAELVVRAEGDEPT